MEFWRHRRYIEDVKASKAMIINILFCNIYRYESPIKNGSKYILNIMKFLAIFLTLLILVNSNGN